MSNLIASKLEFLIDKAGLTAPQFAADFAKAAGVRKAVVEEWLDNRRIYDKNLEKLAGYWRRFFPQIEATHFVMPQEAFERVFGAQTVRRPSAPPNSLPFQTNPLSQTQIGALAGVYRLYWYSLANKPAVQWESLIISADPKSEGALTAVLRTPLARGVQTFSGAVIVWGERMYMVLADVDPSSSAMRFITLHGRFEKKNRNHVLGVMSGAFDKNDTLASRTVALEKQADKPANQNDREEASLREPVDLDRFPAEILLELTQNKLSGIS